jgi:hypothetical protein
MASWISILPVQMWLPWLAVRRLLAIALDLRTRLSCCKLCHQREREK